MLQRHVSEGSDEIYGRRIKFHSSVPALLSIGVIWAAGFCYASMLQDVAMLVAATTETDGNKKER